MLSKSGFFLEDLSLCDRIQKQGPKDACYESVNTIFLNISLCDLISNSETKENCYDWIFLKKPKTRENLFICEKLQDLKNKESCYWYFGMALKDIELCKKVEDEGLKISCMGNLN